MFERKYVYQAQNKPIDLVATSRLQAHLQCACFLGLGPVFEYKHLYASGRKDRPKLYIQRRFLWRFLLWYKPFRLR